MVWRAVVCVSVLVPVLTHSFFGLVVPLCKSMCVTYYGLLLFLLLGFV